jgi:hypothetical protein
MLFVVVIVLFGILYMLAASKSGENIRVSELRAYFSSNRVSVIFCDAGGSR